MKRIMGRARIMIILILVLMMLYSGLQILESTVLSRGQGQETGFVSKTITRENVDYFPRQDITVLLIMGIDQEGPVQSSNYYRNSGSADSIMLLILDEKNEECSVLYVNRDTMLDMDVLGVRNEFAGTTYGQVALAHTYGDGLESSCENVKNTLMKFFHGLTIDYYIAMNMDAVPIMNDAVGGVTVNVKDDFSAVNPSITMGEITLNGDQVLDYVRTRKDVGDQKNITRMERQTEYMDSFLHALQEKETGDLGFIVNLYDEVAPYLVSDCPISTLTNMVDDYTEFAISEVYTLEGENIIGEDHYEFYADEEKLDELAVSLFYAPKR